MFKLLRPLSQSRGGKGIQDQSPAGLDDAWNRLVKVVLTKDLGVVLVRGPAGNGQDELVVTLSRLKGLCHEVWDVYAWEGDGKGAIASLESLQKTLYRRNEQTIIEVRGIERANFVSPGFAAYIAGWIDCVGREDIVIACAYGDVLPHALSSFFSNRGSISLEAGPPGIEEISAIIRESGLVLPAGDSQELAAALYGFNRNDVVRLIAILGDRKGDWVHELLNCGVAVVKTNTYEQTDCPLCMLPVSGDGCVTCPECGTVHHISCWEQNGGCTTYGCPVVGKPPEAD